MTVDRSAPLNSLGPWTLGINNVDSDYELPQGALRDAVNVNLTRSGSARRRNGKVLRFAGDVHSLFSDGTTLYGVSASNLSHFAVQTSGALTVAAGIRSGFVKERPVAYLKFPSPLDHQRVYYSDGILTGMIVNKVHHPWGVTNPSGQPTLTPSAAGGMNAGSYQVAVTFENIFNEESGTGEYARVAVAQGGGIILTNIPQPADASVNKVRIYVSDANGSRAYLHTILPVGLTSAVIARTLSPGRQVDTQFMLPPPAGDVMELHYGRIYIASGSVLRWTEAIRPGGFMNVNSLAFPGAITLIVSTNPGLVVAADKTYFMTGTDPRSMTLQERFPYGSFRGSLAVDERRKLKYWLTPKGLCVTTFDGEMRNLTQGRLALRGGDRATSLLRETDGLRHIIGSIEGGESDSLVHREFITAEGL